jgi:hypothetical protein
MAALCWTYIKFVVGEWLFNYNGSKGNTDFPSFVSFVRPITERGLISAHNHPIHAAAAAARPDAVL